MNTNEKATYDYLKQKYNRLILSKKELAVELNIAISTLDLYISKGIGVPKYKRASEAKNARLLFNIYDIAIYLNSDQIETL